MFVDDDHAIVDIAQDGEYRHVGLGQTRLQPVTLHGVLHDGLLRLDHHRAPGFERGQRDPGDRAHLDGVRDEDRVAVPAKADRVLGHRHGPKAGDRADPRGVERRGTRPEPPVGLLKRHDIRAEPRDEAENPLGVEGVRARHVTTGEITEVPCSGFFVAIGHAPASELVKDQLPTHMGGYVVTEPDSTATAIPAVASGASLPRARRSTRRTAERADVSSG